MSDALQDKTVLFIDSGLFTHVAEKLAQTFKHVLFFNEWRTVFPKKQSRCIATGLDNITHIDSWAQYAPSVDLVVIPDVYYGGEAAFLRDILGLPVWSSCYGEELELDRWQTRQFLKKLKLPVIDAQRIIGVDALAEHLQEVDDKWVKTPFNRGDMETFHHKTWELSKQEIEHLRVNLGPLADDYEFIVEDDVPDALEIGYDGFTVDGQWPDHAMFGVEVKDKGLVGVVLPYEKLPAPVRLVNDKLSAAMHGYGYRNFFSTEIRLADKVPYLIDPTCRAGSPPSELYIELYDNWPEIIWAGAHGEMVSPEPLGKYGVQINLISTDADNRWMPLQIEDDALPYVKLHRHLQRGDDHYYVPSHNNIPEIGAVIGYGDTMQKAIDMAVNVAGQVKGFALDCPTGALAQALQDIDATQETLGVKLADVPDPKEAVDIAREENK